MPSLDLAYFWISSSSLIISVGALLIPSGNLTDIELLLITGSGKPALVNNLITSFFTAFTVSRLMVSKYLMTNKFKIINI